MLTPFDSAGHPIREGDKVRTWRGVGTVVRAYSNVVNVFTGRELLHAAPDDVTVIDGEIYSDPCRW